MNPHPRIAYFESGEGDQDRLAKKLPKAQIVAIPEPLGPETVTVAEDADIVSLMVWSPVTKKMLEEMPRVSFITTRSAGTDHIDLKACAQRGITVSHVPAYGEHTVAEHTFALILALSRKIVFAYERTERMNFDREGLQGFDLFGKTIGVIGTGNIGRHVVRIARGFGMNVIAYDIDPDQRVAAELGFTYTSSLEALLKESDIITLHAPLTDSTRHMMNKDTFSQCKRGALLVNTARGGLVDTEALLVALYDGMLSGVGLDVLEGENETFEDIALLSKGIPDESDVKAILRNHVLIARDDVVVTPHNAFNSREAIERIFDETVRNIERFLSGRPINIVATPKR